MFFSVLCLLCLCQRLFICALWSPAEKGLNYWLSFVVSNCKFSTNTFNIFLICLGPVEKEPYFKIFSIHLVEKFQMLQSIRVTCNIRVIFSVDASSESGANFVYDIINAPTKKCAIIDI